VVVFPFERRQFDSRGASLRRPLAARCHHAGLHGRRAAAPPLLGSFHWHPLHVAAKWFIPGCSLQAGGGAPSSSWRKVRMESWIVFLCSLQGPRYLFSSPCL
jgi:hypothetical protein